MRIPLFMRETIEQARKNPVWGVAYLALLLVPWMLIFARTGMEICGGLVGLLFLMHSARTRQWSWLKQPFTVVCLLAWLWLVLVVTPLAVSPEHSAKNALLWVRFPLFFTAVRYWVLAPRAARTTLGAMLGAMLVLVIGDTLWQLVHGVSLSGHARIESGRLTGPFVTPKVGLFMGKLVLPALALAGAAALAARSRGWMVAVSLLLVAVLVTIMLSGERSIFLMTLLGAGVAAGLAMLRHKQLRVPLFLAGMALLLLLVGLFEMNAWVHLRGMDAWDKITHYADSDYGLLFIAGFEIGREHLLHGVGLSGFRDACPDLVYQGITFRGLHPHHAYMEWFAEAGLPGLLLFLAMIVVLLREAVQHLRAAITGEQFFAAALALGIIAQHFFPLIGMQSFFTNWGAMLLWYGLALAFAALPAKQHG